MPKRTQAENLAISRKIQLLQQEGLRRDRAVAAALKMFRQGKLRTKQPTKKRYAIAAKILSTRTKTKTSKTKRRGKKKR